MAAKRSGPIRVSVNASGISRFSPARAATSMALSSPLAAVGGTRSKYSRATRSLSGARNSPSECPVRSSASAEQGRGLCIGAFDHALPIECHDAVGNRVENRLDRAIVAFGRGKRALASVSSAASASPLVSTSASADQPCQGTVNMRPSAGKSWPLAVRIEKLWRPSFVADAAAEPANSDARRPSLDRIEAAHSRSIPENAGWQTAASRDGRAGRRPEDGRAASVRMSGFRTGGSGRGVKRVAGSASCRSRADALESAQPRGKFLRQFAEGATFDRTQRRLGVGFGSDGCDCRNGTTLAAPALIAGRSASDSPRGASFATSGMTAGVAWPRDVVRRCRCWHHRFRILRRRRLGAAAMSAGRSRRSRASALMRSTSRHTPKPR